MKVEAEAHPMVSPDDEFADFETWDDGNLDASVKKTQERAFTSPIWYNP